MCIRDSNGTTVIDDYGINLDKLKVGDRVAVVRKESGTVHFFVNSEDQGNWIFLHV